MDQREPFDDPVKNLCVAVMELAIVELRSIHSTFATFHRNTLASRAADAENWIRSGEQRSAGLTGSAKP